MALKVLYAADCEMQVTTVHKGMDNYSFSEWLDDSTWLRDALASAGDIDCTHLKVYEVMPSFPTSGSTVSRCCRPSDRRTPSRWARTGSTTCVGSSSRAAGC